MKVYYEMIINYVHDDGVEVPDAIGKKGKEAIEKFLIDNEFDNVKDYGECEIKVSFHDMG